MKKTRRGHGEGSMSERPDGRWQVSIPLARGANGRRRRKHLYAATQADAVALLRKHGGRAATGLLTSTSTPTMASYLTDWFELHADEWRPGTRRSYDGVLTRYLIPAFGTLRLEQVTPPVVQHWLTQHKREHGARRRIVLAHAVLRTALADAQRLQLVTINAAQLVTVPKPTPTPIRALTVAQAQAFLEVASRHRLAPLFSVALACGLRLGEATGLGVEDVDVATGQVTVRQQLQLAKVPGQRRQQLVVQDVKTVKSRRTLTLPQVCLDALRVYRTRQREERLKAGPRWRDSGLLFTTFTHRRHGVCGTGLHPRNVLRTLHGLLRAAGVPVCRFHDLRHSCASLLLAQGVQLAEVSLLLGHSELRITADLYTHLQQQTAAKAAVHMDALLKRG